MNQYSATTRSKLRLLSILTGSSLACLAPFTASAQSSGSVLDEIIVTAQKKSENLQSVPVAVSAFSGEVLEKTSTVNIEDISGMTPGLAVSTYNPVTPQPYIRGIGTNSSSVGDDSSVGVFVDEVYAGRAGGYRADLFDINRVEVLRGPQGTLYGRNVAGGAINVLTNDPTDEFEGRIKATYGRFNLMQIQGVLSGPLDDNVAARVALSIRDRDGYVTNVNSGNKLRDEKNLSLRGKLAIDASDTVRILIGADYAEDDLAGPAARNVVGFEDAFGFALPTEGDPRQVSLFEDGDTTRDMFGVSAKITKDFGDVLLTSVSAYREQDYFFNDDLLGDYLAIGSAAATNDASEKSSQFTQEIRLDSQSGSDLEWTIGAYFFSEDVKRVESFDSTRVYDLIGFGGLGLTSRPLWDGENESTSYAVFGEATYNLNDSFSISLGGRYTHDKKEYANIASGGPDLFGFLAEPGYDVEGDVSFDKFTPKATLQYEFGSDGLLYATYSKGYKAGGFNGIAATAQGALVPFAPENATNYEVGFKSQFADDRLRLNAAAYFLDYTDLQNFTLNVATGQVVTATGDAEIKGIELEATAVLTEGLQSSLSYGYTNSEFKRFDSDPMIVGNSLARTPEHALSASLSYQFDLTELSSLELRGDFTHQSEVFFGVDNDPLAGDDDRSLVNASVTWEHDNGFSVSVWGKNITDQLYNAHAFSLAGVGFAIHGDPATYGVSVSKDF